MSEHFVAVHSILCFYVLLLETYENNLHCFGLILKCSNCRMLVPILELTNKVSLTTWRKAITHKQYNVIISVQNVHTSLMSVLLYNKSTNTVHTKKDIPIPILKFSTLNMCTTK